MELDFDIGTKKDIGTKRASAPSITRAQRQPRIMKPVYADSTFKSNGMSWLILLLLIAFDVVVFSAAFLQVVPKQISKDFQVLASLLYGLAITLLVFKVLFHETWQSAKFKSFGSVILTINFMFIANYFDVFHLSFQVWLLKALLVVMPTFGIFAIIVVMQSNNQAK